MLLQGLKIAVPKPKIKHKTSIIKIGKITKGTVFQDENGVFKISIATKTDEPNPDLLVLEFTDKSCQYQQHQLMLFYSLFHQKDYQ